MVQYLAVSVLQDRLPLHQEVVSAYTVLKDFILMRVIHNVFVVNQGLRLKQDLITVHNACHKHLFFMFIFVVLLLVFCMS